MSALIFFDADLFFKWGDELEQRQSLVSAAYGPSYDSAYTSDIDINFGDGDETISNYSASDSSHYMVEYTDEEKDFIRDTLDWFSDASGIQFNED